MLIRGEHLARCNHAIDSYLIHKRGRIFLKGSILFNGVYYFQGVRYFSLTPFLIFDFNFLSISFYLLSTKLRFVCPRYLYGTELF
jgi:hypothetical protein